MPVGLGEPLYDKLDADIAFVMMGLNAVKGVEIGAYFASVAQRGTTHGDSMAPNGFASNNAGGAGRYQHRARPGSEPGDQAHQFHHQPRESIDVHGNPTEVITKGRHDPCIGIRAAPIAEALLALVVMDHALRHRAQCGDVGTRWRPSKPRSCKPCQAVASDAALAHAGGAAAAGAVCCPVGQLLRTHRVFNPYLPLWLKSLGLPLVTIGVLTSLQSLTRLFAPMAGAC